MTAYPTKMDLANLGSAQVLDLLGPMDKLGVIAVDSAPHTIINLTPVTDKATCCRQWIKPSSARTGAPARKPSPHQNE